MTNQGLRRSPRRQQRPGPLRRRGQRNVDHHRSIFASAEAPGHSGGSPGQISDRPLAQRRRSLSDYRGQLEQIDSGVALELGLIEETIAAANAAFLTEAIFALELATTSNWYFRLGRAIRDPQSDGTQLAGADAAKYGNDQSVVDDDHPVVWADSASKLRVPGDDIGDIARIGPIAERHEERRPVYFVELGQPRAGRRRPRQIVWFMGGPSSTDEPSEARIEVGRFGRHGRQSTTTGTESRTDRSARSQSRSLRGAHRYGRPPWRPPR